MNPAELAREVELPVPTVHRLVTGKSTRPYLSSLKPIADYFSLSINQLLGEEPLPGEYFKNETIENENTSISTLKTIPIISWSEIDNDEAKKSSKQHIVTAGDISDKCFGLIMQDYSMEPVFPKSSVLIFDPNKKPIDRSYALIKIFGKNDPIFRQILVDIDQQYLKPLNPDTTIYKMRLLEKNDIVLACLIESRISHQLKILPENLLEIK